MDQEAKLAELQVQLAEFRSMMSRTSTAAVERSEVEALRAEVEELWRLTRQLLAQGAGTPEKTPTQGVPANTAAAPKIGRTGKGEQHESGTGRACRGGYGWSERDWAGVCPGARSRRMPGGGLGYGRGAQFGGGTESAGGCE